MPLHLQPPISSETVRAVTLDIIAAAPQDDGALVKITRKASTGRGFAPIAKRVIAHMYEQLLAEGAVIENPALNKLFKVRAVRTLSGVAPITVLTKPFPCPGKCVYCPTEPNMPKSYLSDEPAAMRALMNRFDPFTQVQQRLKALIHNGHSPEKMEVLVLGGTWSAYPWKYQQWFVKRLFEAANYFEYQSKGLPVPKNSRSYSLKQAQDINETAKYRIIGLTLETRPDWITDKEIIRLRALGCTRVQVGAQILDDGVLDLIKRGHHVKHLREATKRLRDNCFKFDYHLMPNLPGSTIEKDIDTVKRTFSDDDFKPDQIKLYPTIVNKYAELNDWYQDGRYQPYEQEKLVDLLIALKQIVPYYCRINRLIRDIPSPSIIAGNKVTNLRQILQDGMKVQGLFCRCIRCREARASDPVSTRTEPRLFIDEYAASGGTEYFISYESPDRSTLYAFLRLRLPGADAAVLFDELKGAAYVRELHTYGTLIGLQNLTEQAVQHKGLGRKLMERAEAMAKEKGWNKMAVIAGIGVREYYRKLGYQLEGTYMVKVLS